LVNVRKTILSSEEKTSEEKRRKIMAINKLEDVHRLFADAFNSGDADSIMALYEPEATLVPQPGQVVKGFHAIREAMQGYLALKGRINAETQYVIRAGDIALLRANWSLVGTGPDGKSIEMKGNSTEVVRRQPDENWLFVIDHPFGAD
jgi:uncharacterized protein (TIGR02246 family)